MAAGRRARRAASTLAGSRGCPASLRRGRAAPRPRLGAVPPADHDARRPSRPRAADRGAGRDRRRIRAPAGRRGRRRSSTRRTSRSGRRCCGRRRSATSTRSSSTSRRCGGGAAARSRRRGIGCRSSTSRTSRSCAGRASRSGRRAGRRSSTSSWRSAAMVDTPALDLPRTVPRRRSAATRSSTTGPRATCSATRRRSGSDRPRARTSRCSIGPWIVTPGRAGRSARRRDGPDLAMTATVRRATATRRGVARLVVDRALLVRADARARLRGRARAARRPARQRDGRDRLPARGQGRDARAMARAGRRRDPRDRAARRSCDPRRSPDREHERDPGAARTGRLDTPALVIDLDIVERNARRLGEELSWRGIALRPHVEDPQERRARAAAARGRGTEG